MRSSMIRTAQSTTGTTDKQNDTVTVTRLVDLKGTPSQGVSWPINMERKGSPTVLPLARSFSIVNDHIQIWRHRHLPVAAINMDEHIDIGT